MIFDAVSQSSVDVDQQHQRENHLAVPAAAILSLVIACYVLIVFVGKGQ